MDRRDFFGVIAAPLLRTVVPVVPLCDIGPVQLSSGFQFSLGDALYPGAAIPSCGFVAGDIESVINKIIAQHEGPSMTMHEFMDGVAQQSSTAWGVDQNGTLYFTSI